MRAFLGWGSVLIAIGVGSAAAQVAEPDTAGGPAPPPASPAAGSPPAVAFPGNVADYPDFFWNPPAGVPVVHLDAAAIDSVGTSISDNNMALLDRIDVAYRAGEYGSPGERTTREDALAAFIYNAESAFDFFLELVMQSRVIYSTGEPDLARAFTDRFRNPGLYPVVNLIDARSGFGSFCLKFEVDSKEEREIEISGEKMKAWTEEIEVDGKKFRVVNIDMKTMSHDRVHVVYENYSCGNVRVFDVVQDEQPIRVVTMEEITGQFVRKWGLHRPTAVILWQSAAGGITPPPRSGRRLSSAVYFPGLELELPWFLPSIGFQDVRRFDFPEPLLTLDAVKVIRKRKLDWVEVKDNLRFANWEGDGAIPDFVNERFPDR